jgi:predicted outer membrane repeat protein
MSDNSNKTHPNKNFRYIILFINTIMSRRSKRRRSKNTSKRRRSKNTSKHKGGGIVKKKCVLSTQCNKDETCSHAGRPFGIALGLGYGFCESKDNSCSIL